MVVEQVVNIYPLLQCFIIILAIVGGYNTISTFMNLLSRYGKDKLDHIKDIHVIDKLTERYPLVDTNFMFKPEKEQNIENNQEIHEINKKFAELSEKVEDLINGK